MTAVIATKETGAVARPLRVLVPLIKEDLEQGQEASERAGMPYYQAAGEKLLEARDQLGRGEWGPWLKRNFDRSPRQAQLYMSLAENVAKDTKRARAPFSSLNDFRRRELGEERPSAVHPQSWHQPVKDSIAKIDLETLNVRQAELKRAEERDAQHKLALRLIDIGYKILAVELHPDKGGSRDAMARLNQVRDRLKASA